MKDIFMKKMSEGEMYMQLRIINIVMGIVLLALFIVGFFYEFIDRGLYGFIILFTGALLITYGGQRYLNKHPKLRASLIWIFFGLLIISLAFFYVLIRILK